MDLTDIQRGKGGARGAAARAGLRVLSAGWVLAHGTRAALYGLGLRRPAPLGRPTISVGNLVAGGTGKTPFVAWLATALRAQGHRPGILARGYGPQVIPAQEPGGPLDDEGAVLRCLLGADVPQAQSADRRAGAARLLQDHPETSVLLLDDGFQHWQVARDLDVVLLDALCPFGHGHRLPRGLLREHPKALARADVVVLTRADRIPSAERETLRAQVARWSAALWAEAQVVPAGVEIHGETHPATCLDGQSVLALAGVGNPAGFVATLEGLGAQVIRCETPGDHRAVTPARLDALVAEAAAVQARVVMTRKDAVKLPAPLPAEVSVLDIELTLGPGQATLLDRVAQVATPPDPTGP